ncbi:MAG: hypothetical protein KC502_10740 [Myxococcales bacterium]|nr:hypothetical protein [Myxococcales bacterium]
MNALATSDDAIARALQRLSDDKVIERLVRRDGNLSALDTPQSRQLGWLDHLPTLQEQLPRITVLARVTERLGYDRALILGGQSSWPTVIDQHLRGRRGMRLRQLTAAHPRAIAEALAWANKGKALFVVIADDDWAKTELLYRACRRQAPGNEHYVGVGRRGAALSERSAEFREFFTESADILGPFTATSVSGLVPAVLAGVVVRDALARVEEMLAETREPAADLNPAATLAAFLAAAGAVGHRHLLISTSKDVRALSTWIAETLTAGAGPRLGGLVPWLAEADAALSQEQWRSTAVVSSTTFAHPDDSLVEAGDGAGSPTSHVVMPAADDLWSEAVRWQMATLILSELTDGSAFRVTQPDFSASQRPTNPGSEAGRTLAVPSIKALGGQLSNELKRQAEGEAKDTLVVLSHVADTEANGHRLAALIRRLQAATASAVVVTSDAAQLSAISSADSQIVLIRDAETTPSDPLEKELATFTRTRSDQALAFLQAIGHDVTVAEVVG